MDLFLSVLLCPSHTATPDAASGEPVVLAAAQFPETNAFSRASLPPFYRVSEKLNNIRAPSCSYYRCRKRRAERHPGLH